MKRYPFKNHKITRSNPKKYKRYKTYTKYLVEDFCGRCAYCNLDYKKITTPFEIDHFVPRVAFEKAGLYYLSVDYENLIYSCKKCNLAKGDLFDGNLHENPYSNKLFYDPAKTDYNDIFYRDDYGNICSDDDLGLEMINNLNLHRNIHRCAWLIEQLEIITKDLQERKTQAKSDNQKNAINEVYSNILEFKDELKDVFIANYNSNDFDLNVDLSVLNKIKNENDSNCLVKLTLNM